MSVTVHHVSSVDKLPETEHYAIISNTTTDDGYGGRSPAIEYTAYTNRTEWEERVKELAQRPFTSIRAMVVRPAKVKTVIEMDVGFPQAVGVVNRVKSPCQCASCLGYNGWGASCQGYVP